MRTALERCIATTAEEFAVKYWGDLPLLSLAESLPRDFTDLFSPEAADELVSIRGLRTPFLRMAKQGTVLDSARFTESGGAGAEIGDQASSEKILAEFAEGASLVLQGLHRNWPPLIEFAADLSATLRHPVQVNAYITPASARGFDAHYDVHDVFVLQISGEKRWMIHEPVHPDPLRDQPWTDHRGAVAARATEPPAMDTVLRPGDALYLPRGWLHSAQAIGETSIHLTCGIHVLTQYSVAQALFTLAAQDPDLRRSLPLGTDASDPAQLAELLGPILESFRARLLAPPITDLASLLNTRAARDTRPEPLSPLAQTVAISTMDSDTKVRLRKGLRASVRTEAHQLILLLPEKSLRMPILCVPAIKTLLDGSVHTVSSLPGLDAADAAVLVRRLLVEAVLVPVHG
jgi:ribosomal protein L16 Arg81 hydroxylase